MKNEKELKLIGQIIEDLENYFKRNSHISERKLSEMAGVSRHYVRNIKSGNNFSTKKDLFKLYKVLQIVVPNKSIEIISALDANFFNRSGINVDQALKTLSLGRINTVGTNDLYEAVNDEDEAILVLLASEDNGVSLSMINRVLGENSALAIKNLEDKNVIYLINKRYKVNKNTFTNLSIRFIRRFIPALLARYKIRGTKKGMSYIGMSSGVVNKTGLNEMALACEEFRKKIREIKSRPENQGDIPCFTFHCTDRFVHELEE